MLKTQPFQEAGLLQGQDLFIVLTVISCGSVLHRFLSGSVRVGRGFVQVQGRAEGERFVAALADEAMELADAATKVGLAPDLEAETETDPV